MVDLSNLPGTVADLWSWQLEAACRHSAEGLFFHPEGERGPSRRARDAAAKAVCAGCPSLLACRDHALAVREPYGVWGGLTEDERSTVLATRAAQLQPAAQLQASTSNETMVVVLPEPPMETAIDLRDQSRKVHGSEATRSAS